MKILHVISGISRDSGGPSRSSQGLVAAECRAGVDAWIYPFDGAEPWIVGVRKFRVMSLEFRVQSRGQGIRPLRVFATHRDASKPSDREAELGVKGQGENSLELGVENLKGFDLVHIHGIWDPRLHNVAKMCRAAKVPYIIAPRGMLEPWSLKQKWLKKRIARFLYQDKDLKCAAALHATAESEAEQFRKLGFRNPVVISPNGVNLLGDSNRVERAERVDGERKRVLFVSRMHPKKGVLELVEAWGRLNKKIAVLVNDFTRTWYDIVDRGVITEMSAISISGREEPLVNRRAVKDVFKSFGTVENRHDGRKVTFPAKSVGKMLGQRGVNLYNLADSFAGLFRNSRRAWSETETDITTHRQHRNIDAYHQYVSKFTYAGEMYYIRFTIREDASNNNPRNEVHSSTVSRITVYKAKGAELSGLGNAQGEDSTPFVDNKLSYFLERVNPVEDWNCELVYTVNGEFEREYEAKVKSRILELGMSYQDTDGKIITPTPTATLTSTDIPHFIFTGPLNDDAKWDAYDRADLFVLPTYSENFGIVVAEALWAGVPVITTKGTPWSELEEYKCGKWIDLPAEGSNPSTMEALDEALVSVMAMSDAERSEMGKRGRKLVEEKYTWDAVCKAMVGGYEDVLNHGIH